MSDRAWDRLQAQLRRLDLLLHRQILRMRVSYNLSLDEFRGLYISDQQVDALIDTAARPEPDPATIQSLTRQADQLRHDMAATPDTQSLWDRLTAEFGLSETEQDVLLLGVAPEIDTKYEVLYAYLNNDISRRWPTFDLALRVCADSRGDVGPLFPDGVLFRSGLLQTLPRPSDRISWLATPFLTSPVVAHYLLGKPIPVADGRATTVSMGATADERLIQESRRVAALLRGYGARGPLVVIEGRPGSGRWDTARSICEALDRPILEIDLRSAAVAPERLQEVLTEHTLLQRLYGSALCFTGSEAIFERDGTPGAVAHMLTRCIGNLKPPTILMTDEDSRWQDVVKGRPYLVVRRRMPDIPQRIEIWRQLTEQTGSRLSAEELEALSTRFELTTGQIDEAVIAAQFDAQLSGSRESAPTSQDLFRSARAHTGRGMSGLATKVDSTQTWEHLVLPPIVMKQVKDVANAIRHRHRVYSEWGMARRMGIGTGLTALFAGASGTGKTMTAGVISSDLGQDLYKIDLSGVVSKYIGETEKNLDRIFRVARYSNCILFFDEADALFGKRSEVKDAHDRYANIEVAYLLQKFEEYEGVVILATNLSKNIDAAFARRMNFVVDFPLPAVADRARLWRGMFPPEAPVADDVDFEFLAEQFTLSGGDIKNTVLTAAFLAAQDGQIVTMKQVVRAIARQMIKQGRIPSATDFKQYHVLITETE